MAETLKGAAESLPGVTETFAADAEGFPAEAETSKAEAENKIVAENGVSGGKRGVRRRMDENYFTGLSFLFYLTDVHLMLPLPIG